MRSLRIHYLEHALHEAPGNIADWAHERAHTVSGSRLYAGDPLPRHEYFDMLVILGGPMSIHNRTTYPWLRQEKHFIEKAIELNMPTLGICLGSQLIADVLGADVYPMSHKEIGWYSVTMTAEGIAHPVASALPHHFKAFHWHGETFSVPEGATLLCRSNACLHQGFSLGDNILALQFHPEATPKLVENFVTAGEAELEHARYIQDASSIANAAEHSDDMRHSFFEMLDRLASRARSI
ncbi:MAG TPA: type 1 glutamine amidotransferase [Candidatus Kapabacteria bacterium]|nr:type 1 glutamine amidotransferase [Candidatus Kapabacteria bacterium]